MRDYVSRVVSSVKHILKQEQLVAGAVPRSYPSLTIQVDPAASSRRIPPLSRPRPRDMTRFDRDWAGTLSPFRVGNELVDDRKTMVGGGSHWPCLGGGVEGIRDGIG